MGDHENLTEEGAAEEGYELLEFEGKCVLVTGGSSGIGAETAIRLSHLGASVAIVGRDFEGLIKTGKQCPKIPLLLQADLTNDDELQCVVRTFIKRFNRIDILINAAGIMEMGGILTTSMQQYDRIMSINLRAALHLTQLCTPELIKSQGCIVNVSSVCSLRAVPNLLAYCISKAALDQLTRAIALDLGAQGVRCNAVNLGVIQTPLFFKTGMPPAETGRFLEHAKTAYSVLGRNGEIAEVTEAILFLAGEKSSYITGATLNVDGGRFVMSPKSWGPKQADK